MAEMRNINLDVDTRQKFSINGDPNKVIELDTRDINIVNRYKESIDKMKSMQDDYARLNTISKEMSEISDGENAEEETLEKVTEFTDKMKELERAMRDVIDYIFDTKMCDTICGNSSIFSPVNGKCVKFEQILDTFANLYEKDIKSDMAKINKEKIKKRTTKYAHK